HVAAGMVAGAACDVDVLHNELEACDRNYFTPSAFATLADLAAAVASLDLVITVDTVFAHLAGALGRPTWVLLHAEPDWRWMIDRDDSPWYPTMRLYRQRTPGEWSDVAAMVERDLKHFVERDRC